MNRADIFLQTIAGEVETLKRGYFDLSDETSFYKLATDWLEVMSMVDALQKDGLTQEQQERLGALLKELQEVKPIVERLGLTWIDS